MPLAAASIRRDPRRTTRGSIWRHRLWQGPLRSRSGRLYGRIEGIRVALVNRIVARRSWSVVPRLPHERESQNFTMAKKSGIPIAFWLALLFVVPLAGIFFLSLAAATVIGGAALSLYYLLRAPSRPLPERREPRAAEGTEIELDPSQYRRLSGGPGDEAS